MAIKFKTPKTAINTTTRDMQNLSSDCPPCPEVNLTTADVEYTANGEYTVTPEAGYDGLTQVDITVSVPSDINNQNKTVTPTTSSQSVTADSGYSGLGTVTVEAVTAAIDENIQSENILSGVTILGVEGSDAGYTAGYTEGYDAGQADCPAPVLETVTATYTTNDTYTITPTQGYDGIDEVTVTVNTSNCPDWSSIGWTCSDVTASGLADEVAYSASVKNQSTWQNDKKLVFAPVTSTSNAGTNMFSGSSLRYAGNLTFTSAYSSYDSLFANCTALRRVGNITASNRTTGNSAASMFQSCSNITSIGTIDFNNINVAQGTFKGCSKLTTIGGLINTSNINTMYQMFLNCSSLTTFPLFDSSSVTNMSYAFSNCTAMTSFPQYDTSEVTTMEQMFYNTFKSPNTMTTAPSLDTSSLGDATSMFANGSANSGTLVTVPLYDFSKVYSISDTFKYQQNLTTLAGFTNLGKNFNRIDQAIRHTLDLSASTALTKQSIMNVINNLAAPDDTNVTDATLKLSSTCYALLDASDIAIATAKNWSVISA